MQNIALGRLRRNLHLQPRSCVLLQPCCSIDVCYVFRWCTKPFLKQEREEKDKKQSSTRSSREATRTHKGGKGEMKKKRRKNVKPNRVNEKIMQASVARPLSSLSLFPALAFAISSTPIFFFSQTRQPISGCLPLFSGVVDPSQTGRCVGGLPPSVQ